MAENGEKSSSPLSPFLLLLPPSPFSLFLSFLLFFSSFSPKGKNFLWLRKHSQKGCNTASGSERMLLVALVVL